MATYGQAQLPPEQQWENTPLHFAGKVREPSSARRTDSASVGTNNGQPNNIWSDDSLTAEKYPWIGMLKANNFTFQPRKGDPDLEAISSLDLNRVAALQDFPTLESLLSGLTYADLRISQLQNLQLPLLLKMFRTMQLELEYLTETRKVYDLENRRLKLQVQRGGGGGGGSVNGTTDKYRPVLGDVLGSTQSIDSARGTKTGGVGSGSGSGSGGGNNDDTIDSLRHLLKSLNNQLSEESSQRKQLQKLLNDAQCDVAKLRDQLAKTTGAILGGQYERNAIDEEKREAER